MKRSLLIYVAGLCLLSSCTKKTLDLYPETSITEGNFYTTEGQIVQAVNDVYRQLEKVYDAGGIPDLYGEMYSDNAYIEFSAGATTYPEDITKHRITTDNGKILSAWQSSYSAINICNNAIYQLDKTTIQFSNPALKTRLRAEALFIRSLIYFNLVRAFGDIPFPLTVMTPQESYNYLREKKEVVYQQLIKDLTESKANLPASYTGTDIGRITKYGASAVLAKVYLTTGDRTNAAKELKEIIDSGVYSLDANGDGAININDYRFLFAATTKNSKESIVEVQYLAGQNNVNSTHQQIYAPYHFEFHLPGTTETFRGEGMNTPTTDLINEFEAADSIRKNITAYPGYVSLGTGQFVNYPFTMKFYDPNWRYAGQNFEIIRYADILLMYAEATDDPIYLNQVRARAGLPLFGQPGYPAAYSTLAKAIEHERRVELSFEFHRFFDLARTGRAVEVLTSKGYTTVTNNNLVFPIPQNEIDINPKLIQNQGY